MASGGAPERKEMFRRQWKPTFAGLIHENLLAIRGDQAVRPSLCLWIRPTPDASFVAAGDFSYGTEAATKLDNGSCRFHVAIIAIIASKVKPLCCDFRGYRAIAIYARSWPWK